MAFAINHHMLRFQVPVYNQVLMHVLNRADNLCSIKVHIVSDAKLVGPDPAQQVAAPDKIHLDVDVLLVVEGRVCSDKERAIVAIFG